MESLNKCIRLDDGEFIIEGELYDLPLMEIIADITIQHISDVPTSPDVSIVEKD
jgi:hypothetical protein